MRIVVLNVEAGQVDGPVPVGDRHQLDHLQHTQSNPSQKKEEARKRT